MTTAEKSCKPCNGDCNQGRDCPERTYQPNIFLLACLGSLAVWVVVLSCVYVIFK